MLTLYYKPTCPFSQAVLAEAEVLGLKIDLKDISTDKVLDKELVEKGGKHQTPYLIDPERREAMYESKDIISYLYEHYGGGKTQNSFAGVRIHNSDETCDSCQ